MPFAPPGYAGTGEYKSVFPSDLSLEDCEGEQNSEFIEFTHDVEVLNSVIDKDLRECGAADRTSPLACYHSHVLWSYSLWAFNMMEGTLGFGLVSVGPYMQHDREQDDGKAPNAPEGLHEPPIEKATFTFMDKKLDEKESYAFKKFGQAKPDNWIGAQPFSHEELLSHADGDRLYIRLRIVIPRSYFSLSKLLKEPTTVSEGTEEIVKTILRGDKPAGSDWSITVGSAGGDGNAPLTYHVHSSALRNFSGIFKEVFDTRSSYSIGRLQVGGDVTIEYQPDQQTLHIAYLAPSDMTVLIPLIYGMDPPLPTNIGRLLMLGPMLGRLLRDRPEVFFDIFPHWERAICEQALALDKTDPGSFSVIQHHLMIVWRTPFGKMPVAKRVAIGVYADMVRLQKPAGVQDVDHINASLSEQCYALARSEYGKKGEDVDLTVVTHACAIVRSMCVHYSLVSAVRKVGLPAKTLKTAKGEVRFVRNEMHVNGLRLVPNPHGLNAFFVDSVETMKETDDDQAPASDDQTDVSDDDDDKKEEEMKRDDESPPPVVTRNLDVPTVLNVEDDDEFFDALEPTEENPESAQRQCVIS